MAQTVLWLLPDFMGSEMYFAGAAGGVRRVWLDLFELSQDGLDDALRLPLAGGQTAAGGMIDTGGLNLLGLGSVRYTDFLRRAIPDDWQPVIWSYDWRGGAQVLGGLLAAAIRRRGPVPGGHRILGLGYGGLVGCAAYGALVDQQQQQLVPRVVTIGAPLAGTYAVPQTWRFEPNPYNTLSNHRASLLAPLGIDSYPFARQARTVGTFVTWPSTYDLLPDPAAWDDPGDQFRPQLWDATLWANAVVPPDAALMQASRTGFRAWINGAGRWPPPGVLVCGVGTGQPTPRRLQLPAPDAATQAQRYLRGGILRTGLLSAGLRRLFASRILTPGAVGDAGGGAVAGLLGQQYLGDGIATPQSQSRPGVQYVSCPAGHFALPSDPVIRRNLLAMLSGPGLPAGPLDVETALPWLESPVQPVPDLPRGDGSVI